MYGVRLLPKPGDAVRAPYFRQQQPLGTISARALFIQLLQSAGVSPRRYII